MNNQNIILKARDIKKYYGQEQVLDIKEFKLYESSFNLLLGPNGSGKTTLLRILSLVDKDYEGKILYRGESITTKVQDLLALRRKFSVIWQDPYLYNGTVAENIGLPLKLRQIKSAEIDTKVKHLANKLNISHLLMKGSRELSGGEKQKVSIARALITEPEILFIDEPTTNLDFESNQFFNSLFADLVINRGMTIMLITHDLHQIKNLGDYIFILKEEGKISISGKKDEILSQNGLKNINLGLQNIEAV